MRVCHTRQAHQNISQNQRNLAIQGREKFGIDIPQNTRQALLLDKQNKNTKWADAIAKEMEGMKRLDVFEFHSPGKRCPKDQGWQYASMHMIFDVKKEDLCHKA